MGLYIHATINLKGISDKDWESAWQKSLDIFKRFPLPLSRHTIETELGEKRHVYSQNLVLNKGKKDECWYLEGDLVSMQSSETFVLYRHLESYKEKYGTHHGCFEESVFKTDDATYPSSSNGIELWDSKTQGYPFHLAILAVGIVLENQFPDNCYIHAILKKSKWKSCLNGLKRFTENHLIIRFASTWIGCMKNWMSFTPIKKPFLKGLLAFIKATEPMNLKHSCVLWVKKRLMTTMPKT